jgi:CheY-like chemotaxis protein
MTRFIPQTKVWGFLAYRVLRIQPVFSVGGVTIKIIMIVVEETDIVKQVKAILEKEDVEVVTATDSRQALSRLKEENEETSDLILVNTRMPGSQKTTALFSMKNLY